MSSRVPSVRPVVAWLCLSACAVCVIDARPHAQSASDEYRLKAAFVYRFPQFVQWPEAALQDARTVDLCVVPPNPFGSDLEHLATGESLAGRPLRVRILKGDADLAGCHAIFAGANSAAAAAVLKAAAGQPVLTIGETDEFLREGGIIVLRLVDRRVRFEVSATNARRAGLRISAQLLGLAAAVHGARE